MAGIQTGSNLGRTFRVGILLFVAGVIAIAVDVLPFFFGAHNRPLWLNLICLAAPAGFVTAVVSAWAAGRADARTAGNDLSTGASS